ncbi:MAG: L-2-amino-thiazoline-4-carboxylic acid hydrolase [Promethearchaeota archaeon]|nr:MAG: L-2-amino-thiazoline-4-carboxylic acid hydrolase [Candidatus Lokiarchaeota archaeon]
MIKETEKSKEKFEISYEDYFKTRFYGIVELMRVLSPILDNKKALDIVKKLWEKKGIDIIVRQLKNTSSIRNFNDFKEIYKEQISTEYMQHCLKFTMEEDTQNKLAFKFTKCLWAETFLEMEASDIGDAMCCYPDFAMAKAFHPKLKLIRTKTLMKGDDFCDSTYIWEE